MPRRRASWLLGRTEVVVVWQELPGARSLGARCWVLVLGGYIVAGGNMVAVLRRVLRVSFASVALG